MGRQIGKGHTISNVDADLLHVRAAKVFQPRTPITTRELFAGRWSQMTTLADAVGQAGLHVVIYGERGVGKTSLSNVVKPLIHVFDAGGSSTPERLVVRTNASSGDTFSSIWKNIFTEITWEDERPAAGLVAGKKRMPILRAFDMDDVTLNADNVRRLLARLPGALFIVDEFDRAIVETTQEFTDLMKALSDFSVNCTVILVGVSDTVDALVSNHGSISRALVQIRLPRMDTKELAEILTNAEKALSEKSLSVSFSDDAANLIVHISQGLPHYTHLLGLHAVRASAKRLSSLIERQDVFAALKEAVKQAEQTVTEKHSKAVHSAHKDALYRHVLLACAITGAQAHDALGYFNPGAIVEPLQSILGRDVQIATFSTHLSEFCQAKRGEVLEKIGQERAFRFRFHDPLLVPFVFMDAVAHGLLTDKELAAMLGSTF